MNQSFLALAFQEAAPVDASTWIILAVVLVILFFIVVIVAVGLTLFFIMRKRSKALKAPAQPEMSLSAGPNVSAYADKSQPVEEKEPPVIAWSPPSTAAYASMSQPEPAQMVPEREPAPPIVEYPAPKLESPPQTNSTADTEPFDPTRTVAIIREKTVPISYGSIRFVSGVLEGEQFEVNPEGAYVGRESTLSQIVVADPRISKRHLWIGVRDGAVKIIDQDSRNGTFLNDPKSERITEATLNSGDTVIMGESDVARFEYQQSTLSP